MSASGKYVPLGVAAALASAAALYYFYSQSNKDSCNSSSNESSSTGIKSSNKSGEVTLDIPVVDFAAFFDQDKNPTRYAEECAKVAHALHQYGLVVVRDPRVSEADNTRFLDLMERYFESSDGVRDSRPEFSYQVGVTKEFTELPRNHCKRMGAFGPDENKPLSPCPPERDPKWRFFWRTGPQPPHTEFPAENMDDVIPPEFPEWKEVMDMWGGEMTQALFTVAEMAAVGFQMPKDAFTSRMLYGSHLLAPTGSDFNKFGDEGRVLAGFHYDFNFLTIHGKSRFPGLNVWTREGKKTAVVVPDGCLLVQAGRQIEYLTGGYVLAGFHEVVVNQRTTAAISARKAAKQSLWRVSSTTFGHIQSDQMLQPLPPFDSAAAMEQFPPIKTGHFVIEELKAIALSSK